MLLRTLRTFWGQQQQTSLGLGLVLLAALAFRLVLLTHSFWLDEAAQALESARPWWQQLDLAADFQPPLLHLLLWAAIRVSTSEWWLRVIGAVIPSLLTIYLTWHIGRDWFSTRAAHLAAWGLATNSFYIYFSQELRPYAWAGFLVVLSWWVLIKLTSTQKKLGSLWWPTGWWTAYILVQVAGFYTMYLFPFHLLGQALWLGWQKKNHLVQWQFLTHWLASMLAVAIGFVPWLPHFLAQLNQGSVVTTSLPGWSLVVGNAPVKSLLLVTAKFIFGVVDVEISVFFMGATGLLLGLMGILFLAKLQLKQHLNSGLMGALAWLVVPLVAAWLMSWFIPVLQPKRVLFLLPAWYLIWAAILDSFLPTSLKDLARPQPIKTKLYARATATLAIALFLATLGLNLWGVSQYYTKPQLQREDWRSLHAQLKAHYPPTQTLIVMPFSGVFAPWQWYDHNTFPVLTFPGLHANTVSDFRLYTQPVTNYTYVVVFDYLADLTDPQRQTLQAIKAYGFKEIESFSYPLIGQVWVLSNPQTQVSTLQ